LKRRFIKRNVFKTILWSSAERDTQTHIFQFVRVGVLDLAVCIYIYIQNTDSEYCLVYIHRGKNCEYKENTREHIFIFSYRLQKQYYNKIYLNNLWFFSLSLINLLKKNFRMFGSATFFDKSMQFFFFTQLMMKNHPAFTLRFNKANWTKLFFTKKI